MGKLRILLADDHRMFREGLRALVGSEPDMDVVGEADDGRAAVALAERLRPDLVLMDVSMPSLNGLQATERIKQNCPQMKVLALTRHADDGYLRQLLKAGVAGYVLKRSGSDELLRAVRAVAAGQSYLDPSVASSVITDAVGRHTPGADAGKELSRREEQILQLIARGYANKEIAARLDVSVKTVEMHKANAMRKLGMTSRIDIVSYAILQGWLHET